MCNRQSSRIVKRHGKNDFKAEYSKDDLILHKVFGKGRVIEIDMKNKSYKIKFDKFDTDRNINFRIKMGKTK